MQSGFFRYEKFKINIEQIEKWDHQRIIPIKICLQLALNQPYKCERNKYKNQVNCFCFHHFDIMLNNQGVHFR